MYSTNVCASVSTTPSDARAKLKEIYQPKRRAVHTPPKKRGRRGRRLVAFGIRFIHHHTTPHTLNTSTNHTYTGPWRRQRRRRGPGKEPFLSPAAFSLRPSSSSFSQQRLPSSCPSSRNALAPPPPASQALASPPPPPPSTAEEKTLTSSFFPRPRSTFSFASFVDGKTATTSSPPSSKQVLVLHPPTHSTQPNPPKPTSSKPLNQNSRLWRHLALQAPARQRHQGRVSTPPSIHPPTNPPQPNPPTRSSLRFASSFASLVTDKSNLVLRALDLFRQKTGTTTHFSVYLEKRTPVQAGLGGGSSNAATTLFAANQLLGCPASDQDLIEWSKELGSDITFFLSKGTAYCTGRGEILEPLPTLSSTNEIYIVKPPIGLSTPGL